MHLDQQDVASEAQLRWVVRDLTALKMQGNPGAMSYTFEVMQELL